MKRIKIIAFLLITLCAGFSSCKKDDDDEPTAKSKIVGKWYINKDVSGSYQNGTLISESTYTDYGADDYFEFTSDGKLLYLTDGTSTVQQGTYTINDAGTELILSEDADDNDVFKITTLTATSLVLEDEDVVTSNGVTITYKEVITHSRKSN